MYQIACSFIATISSKNEVRSFADVAYDVCLRPVDDPVTHAWSCGRLAVLGGALDDRWPLLG